MIRCKRFDAALLLLAFAVSIGVRLALTHGFDGLYGQDAYAYYNFAGDLRQALSEHRAPEPFFWPLGYPVLLALSFALFGTAPLTAQSVTLLLGALTAPLTYILARQLSAGKATALVAALLVALCGQAVQSSIVVMSDTPALFWATLSAVLLLRYLRNHQRRWLFFSAFLLALACVTRWLYLALIPVWGAALLVTWRHIRWRELIVAGAAAALVFVPQAAVSIHSPFPVLDHPWVAGWSLNNAGSHQFSNEDGQFDYAQINALFYAQPFFDPYYLAPLFAPFVLGGIWLLRRQPALLALLFGWVLVPYAFLVGIPYQNIRFALILVPPLAVLAALGLEQAIARFATSSFRFAFAIAVLGSLFWMFSAGQPVIQQFIRAQARDKAAVQWAIAHIPPATRVYCYGLTQPLAAYTSFEVHELYDETPLTLAVELADSRESYLFSNVWVLENQWQGRMLQTTFHWLRDTPGLLYLDRIGNYILFRIDNENWTPASGFQQSVG